MLDLAPMREGLAGPERKHRPRVLGAREGTPGWEAGAEATTESGPRAGKRSGERAHRVVPGLKAQLLLQWPQKTAREVRSRTAWSRARHLLEAP